MISVLLTNKEDLEVVARPTDSSGAHAKVESFTVTSADQAILGDGEVVETEEGGQQVLTARCVTVATGQAQLVIKADIDLGEGVETIEEVIEVTVTSTKASNLGLSASGVPKEEE